MSIFDQIKESTKSSTQNQKPITKVIKKDKEIESKVNKKSIKKTSQKNLIENKEKLFSELQNDKLNDLFKTQVIEKVDKQKLIKLPKQWHKILQSVSQQKNVPINFIVRQILIESNISMNDQLTIAKNIKESNLKNDYALNIRFRESEIKQIEEKYNDIPFLDFTNYCKIVIYSFINN